MWWSKTLTVAAFLAAASLPAQQARCPAWQGKSPLVSVDIFDGPPADKADLVPDIARGSGHHAYASWQVGYIFDSHRALYLMCSYKGMKVSEGVAVKVENKVNRCIYRTHPGGAPAEAFCK